MMRICFVGLGSIGRRHVRNLAAILEERSIPFRMDALRHGQSELPPDVAARLSAVYTDTARLPADYDIVFVTNPTIQHYDTIRALVAHTRHMFIEKPLFHTSAYELSALGLRPGCVYYVACPLRYSRVYTAMKDIASSAHVFSVQSLCSTYLPDWRKGVDYRTVYSARRELGGGVGLDLIHEWDYLVDLFGFPQENLVLQGKFSDLELTSDDMYASIARYADKVVEVHLDYFGRIDQRTLTFYTADDVITGDFIANTVTFRKSGRTVCLPEDGNDAHYHELEHFLDICDGNQENVNDVEKAYRVLSVLEGHVRG
ncbi:MAG TPA: oxidoreductase [Treponema sp.]|nr:oxidoreductase [Treponema sp.]